MKMMCLLPFAAAASAVAWSLVLALALADVAWFSFAFDLFSVHLNY
jgi:hypothetical protein